jgi:hypothetical protein
LHEADQCPEHQTLALRAKIVFGLEQEAALVILRIFEDGEGRARRGDEGDRPGERLRAV